jgi:hypothetical protein
MKLFLLNSRENNKPRKISFIFLGFFCNFLHILKASLEKEKGKVENSDGVFVARDSPTLQETGSRAHARPRALVTLQKGPRRSKECAKNPRLLFNVSLTAYIKVPGLSFLPQLAP